MEAGLGRRLRPFLNFKKIWQPCGVQTPYDITLKELGIVSMIHPQNRSKENQRIYFIWKIIIYKLKNMKNKENRKQVNLTIIDLFNVIEERKLG